MYLVCAKLLASAAVRSLLTILWNAANRECEAKFSALIHA